VSRQQRETTGLEIAIVGMSGRYPGAANLAELWANLRDGVEPITRFSDEELAETGLDASLLENPELIREGFVLGDIDLFDAAFFGYTPREAELIDPQQRIFLECAWEALEAAGCDPGRYPGPIGVFAGSGMSSYLVENLLPNRDIVRQVGGLQLTLANDKDYVATRAAYKMNLRGPAVCVQTACSTSLVAVHLACQSLLAGDCDVALAGGVSIRTRQKYGYVHQDGGIASRDGHCRPFDADASGTAGGNGVGIVVLKRLADALESGDRIEAVILGSAMNNDGSGKIGFTAPSVEGQAQAIEAAQRMAGVEPDDITYIEAHGTGTPLGDPMEIRALTRVFRARTHRKQFCGIGSIKSNFGHTDVAAGVAGLIKAVLALENRALPPSLHFERPNPEIDFESSPFYVNATLRDWTSEGAPRRAGVSSFGLGGTNVHVVLEEAPEPPAPAPARPWQVLTLSAQTEGALEEATRNLVEHLEAHPELELADVAYTLHVGRASFRTRRTVACRDVADAVAALGPPDPKRVWDAAQEFGEREVVFMFPGQGTQHVDMARGLYASEPVFREIVDECCGDLEADLGLDLRAVMHPESGDPEDCAERLRHTALAQPALFVVEYALARLWMSWGVVPSACIGHSIGEYVAACVSGVLSRRDALSLVAARGRLMGQTPPGAMLAIPRPENEVKAMLGDGMDLAAVNAPSLCVVSGTGAAMDRLQSELGERGIACQRLHTSHAFHSHLMDPVVERFASLVAGVPLSEPDRPFVSNVTGGWIDAATATDPSYWARHLREPVRFTDGLAALLEDPDRVLLEVGPGRTLASLAKQHPLCGPDRATASSMRHPTEPREDGQCLLDALGRLWAAGVRIDWEGFHATERRRRVPLPTYPFDRQRYWIDPPSGHRLGSGGGRTQPQRSRNAEDWLYVPSWKRSAMHTQREASPRLDEPARWLVFADGCGLADGLVERLERRGHEVWIARPGAAFQRLGEREFALAAADPEHYASLLEALGRLPDSIVHAWGVDSAEGVDGETLLDRCFFSPLFLAQAVGPRGTSEALDLAIVTSGIHEVTGTELPSPEKATALGPVGAISREYPAIRCRSVDVELERGAAGAAVEPLLAELALATGDRVVAYRGGHRWVRSVEPLRLELPEEEGGRLRQGGVYLVTGGRKTTWRADASARCASWRRREGRSWWPPPTSPIGGRWRTSWRVLASASARSTA
jgi:acyl transferase domain-containing protein